MEGERQVYESPAKPCSNLKSHFDHIYLYSVAKARAVAKSEISGTG